jgi:hypothetical protein
MATCAHSGQAVGLAAALCARDGLAPRDLVDRARMAELQRRLLRAGQFIPGVALHDATDLAARATLDASSISQLSELPTGPDRLLLTDAWAMLLPVAPGPMPAVTFTLDVANALPTGSVTIAGQSIGLQEAVPAPTGLTATAVSSSQIDLSWDAVEGA